MGPLFETGGPGSLENVRVEKLEIGVVVVSVE